MTTEPTTVTDEITAMRRIVATLDRLDPTTRERVVRWLGERYQLPPVRLVNFIDAGETP